MKKRTKWIVSFVFLLVGFMVAVQFQTTSEEPEKRETRDQWEVREELLNQQEERQELLVKISEADKVLADYKEESSKKKVDTLKQSIHELEEKIGLSESEGSGVEITIKPIFQESEKGQTYPAVSPELLSKLINELNMFGAQEIAIGNERLTNLSPIRDVNGFTYVNNRPLPPLPVKIHVLSKNPKKLLDYIEASQSKDFFAIENLGIEANSNPSLVLPKYEDPLKLEYLQENKKKETGE
ncbi:DUF881 domain-containing protein [Halobacillus salinarum]|uniref:DUF881 domain-containing protein n=1 Tax=Halobacillus salinarum TaxID=2932257 RepID=A0ABY4EF83_9BACI|nr:DUF881 domain-containing protein [Halobacillus salinarum]UOQ43131.1 DUF881 domain-containing protein [Halobacillus salinarum]